MDHLHGMYFNSFQLWEKSGPYFPAPLSSLSSSYMYIICRLFKYIQDNRKYLFLYILKKKLC